MNQDLVPQELSDNYLPEVQLDEKEISGGLVVEQTRAVQEVQASIIIAKKFPRDMNVVYTRIMEACKRTSLAEKSVYQYPRGGAVISGPSIRLAEMIAQNYGNLDFGIREVERRNGSSKAISYCWDKETNTRKVLEFEVEHTIEAGKKGAKFKKKLTDPRDIYELVANNGSRRMRSCILAIIPGDIIDDAVKACKNTIAKGNGEPIEDRIRKMVVKFKELGVSQQMIEERLGHGAELITLDQIVDLTGIYTAIRDKQSKRSDFFNFIEDQATDEEVALANEKLASVLRGPKNVQVSGTNTTQ